MMVSIQEQTTTLRIESWNFCLYQWKSYVIFYWATYITIGIFPDEVECDLKPDVGLFVEPDLEPTFSSFTFMHKNLACEHWQILFSSYSSLPFCKYFKLKSVFGFQLRYGKKIQKKVISASTINKSNSIFGKYCWRLTVSNYKIHVDIQFRPIRNCKKSKDTTCFYIDLVVCMRFA